MFEVALAADPTKVNFVGKGDLSSVTVGFEFEFICKLRVWPRLRQLVQDNLGPVGAVTALYGKHHDRADTLTAWHITGDTSIKDYDLGDSDDDEDPPRNEGETDSEYNARVDKARGETGVELVSPVLKASEAIATLGKALKMLKDLGARTNNSCSLHVTLGHPKIKEYLDPIKFAIFLGDDKILKHFDRSNNEYASSLLDAVRESLADASSFHEKVQDASTEQESDDSWDPDQLERDIEQTPFEVMKTELLSKSAKGASFIHEGRRKLLEYLAKFNSGVYDDRYHSVNLQKVNSNIVEYRAIGSDYLNESPAALSGMVRRIMYALLVAVGDVSSPKLDQAYAALLTRRFGLSDPSREGKLIKSAGGLTSPVTPYAFTKAISVDTDLHLDVTIQIIPDYKLNSIRFFVVFAVIRDNASVLGHAHELVSLKYTGSVKFAKNDTTGKTTFTGVNYATSEISHYAKSGSSAYLTRSEVAKIYKEIKDIIATPTNPYLNNGWKALAITSRSYGVSPADAINVIRDSRIKLFSQENNNRLKYFMAYLVVQHMDPKDVQSRYVENKNKHVDAARAFLKSNAFNQVLAMYHVSIAYVTENLGDLVFSKFKQRVEDPFNLSLDGTKSSMNAYQVSVTAASLAGMGYFTDYTEMGNFIINHSLLNQSAAIALAELTSYLLSAMINLREQLNGLSAYRLSQMASDYARYAGILNQDYSDRIAETFRLGINFSTMLLSASRTTICAQVVLYVYKYKFNNVPLGRPENLEEDLDSLYSRIASDTSPEIVSFWRRTVVPALLRQSQQ